MANDRDKDGGMAFPSCVTAEDGMSLRDYFAGQALIAYASSPRVMDKAFTGWIENGGQRPTCIAEFLAGLAYEAADAMLKAREGAI